MVPCGYVVVVAVVSSLVQISSNRGFLSNSQFAADNSCHQDCEEKLIIKKNTIIHDIYIYTLILNLYTHTHLTDKTVLRLVQECSPLVYYIDFN